MSGRIVMALMAIAGGMFGTTAVMFVLLTAPAFVEMDLFRWMLWAVPLLLCWAALLTRAVSYREASDAEA